MSQIERSSCLDQGKATRFHLPLSFRQLREIDPPAVGERGRIGGLGRAQARDVARVSCHAQDHAIAGARAQGQGLRRAADHLPQPCMLARGVRTRVEVAAIGHIAGDWHVGCSAKGAT